ncbi:MAG: NAD(P)H-binding protein [Flavobacteriaceae bacterium]|nr:NAD(P)H-binding protein [Flavobacteriaceae bacterium]
MGKRAIVLGATGLTGGLLIDKLLEDSRYDSILSIGRRTLEKDHYKLEEVILDLMNLEEYSDKFKGDVVFCCVGTTKAKTPDKEIYKKIDKGIPVSAAKLCKQNSIGSLMVISALGADKNSRIFYNRVKGEMEEEVLSYKVPTTYILEPSLIMGDRDEKRGGEGIAQNIMGFLSPLFLGGLKKYKPISAEAIAECMIWLDNNSYEKSIIPSPEIQKIAGYD